MELNKLFDKHKDTFNDIEFVKEYFKNPDKNIENETQISDIMWAYFLIVSKFEKSKGIVKNVFDLLDEDTAYLSSRDFELKYLKKYHCENDTERAVLDKVFSTAPSGSSIKRTRAMIQNIYKFYPRDTKEQQVSMKKFLGYNQ